MKVPEKAECRDHVRLEEGRPCQPLEGEKIRPDAGADKFVVGGERKQAVGGIPLLSFQAGGEVIW